MKILFLTNYYPPFEMGGYEQLCRDVVVRLMERGHEVVVLTSETGAGQTVDEARIYRKLKMQLQKGRGMGVIARFLLMRKRIEKHNRKVFQKLHSDFLPNIVFIWNLQGLPQELTLDAESAANGCVAYWLAGYFPREPDQFWRYWSQKPLSNSRFGVIKEILSPLVLAQMKREGKPVRPQMLHVAVVSQYMRKRALDEYLYPDGIRVIPNGVEIDKFWREVPFGDVSSRINVLLAGRISPDKGVHTAVEAIGALAKSHRHHDFHFYIVGDGPAEYIERLKSLAHSLHVSNRISFVGWLPRERISAVMRECHIFLLTSIYPEAFSRAVLEAMAAGLAVIGTQTGGTGELLEHMQNGLVFAPEDGAELARHIGILLDDPALRCKLAKFGQTQVVSRYDMEHMIDRLEQFLQEVVVASH